MAVRNAVCTKRKKKKKEKVWGSVNKQSGWFFGYLRELRGTKQSSHCHVLAQIRSGILRKRYFLLLLFLFLFYLVLEFVFTARGKNAHERWSSRRGHSACVASAEMKTHGLQRVHRATTCLRVWKDCSTWRQRSDTFDVAAVNINIQTIHLMPTLTPMHFQIQSESKCFSFGVFLHKRSRKKEMYVKRNKKNQNFRLKYESECSFWLSAHLKCRPSCTHDLWPLLHCWTVPYFERVGSSK